MSTRSVVTIPLADLPSGGRRIVVIDETSGLEITLLRQGEKIVALRNQCPHANGRLGDGRIVGDSIECPLHKWTFHLESGCTKRDRKLKATLYAARVEDGNVVVDVETSAGLEIRR